MRNISTALRTSRLEEKSRELDELRALYFNCDTNDKHIVKPTLEKMYSSAGEGAYILGMKV